MTERIHTCPSQDVASRLRSVEEKTLLLQEKLESTRYTVERNQEEFKTRITVLETNQKEHTVLLTQLRTESRTATGLISFLIVAGVSLLAVIL